MLDAYLANLTASNYLGPHQVLPLSLAIALAFSAIWSIYGQVGFDLTNS